MKVIVIFGGKSSEHDVSCVSAGSIIENMVGHDVYKIGITLDGRWFRTDATAAQIKSGEWEKCPNEAVTIDINNNCFVCGGKRIRADVVFPVLHGRNGEDGRIQGLFEMLQIPYVGCRVLSSAVCMDKAYTNAIFDYSGINHVAWLAVEKFDYEKDRDAIIRKTKARLHYPIFIKPSNAGSSVGITKCRDDETLVKAFELAFMHDSRVVAEQGLEHIREIETAVLGNDEPVVSVAGRIQAAAEFYDYDAKYSNPESRLFIPADIEDKISNEIRMTALKAYKACDCKGLARVDFFVDNANTVYINEINTLPGFTSISMYPKLFEASGIPYSELIDRLLALAVQYGE